MAGWVCVISVTSPNIRCPFLCLVVMMLPFVGVVFGNVAFGCVLGRDGLGLGWGFLLGGVEHGGVPVRVCHVVMYAAVCRIPSAL